LLTSFQLQYGISDRFQVGVTIPYVHREHTHIHHEDGGNVQENWNFNGLGDIAVIGNYSVINPEMQKEIYLGISAGIKLPTGLTSAVNGDGEKAEVTIQPGSGSYDALAGINFNYPLFTIQTTNENEYSTIPLILGILYKIPGKGTEDYQYGNTLLITAGTDYQFTSEASLTLQVNFRNQGYANVGSTGEPKENTGGTKIFISPGLNLSITDYLSFFGIVQLPVYQNFHGIQQTSRFNTQIGISADTNLL
jgi:hypothetical protein